MSTESGEPQIKAKGVWGVWIQVPYFSKSFKHNLSDKAKGRLGEEFIRVCGEKGSRADRDHAQAAMGYAQCIGLEVFSTEYEEPTRFFEPWHEVYERPMPYWHQLVNAIDLDLDGADDDDFLILTREHAQSILSPLPEIDWAEPLRHKRAAHYRAIVKPLPDGRLPKQGVDGFWKIMWNDDLFCKSLGPTSFTRFAHACVIEDDEIIPLLDSNGDRLMLYRRQGWPYTFAEVPELA